MDEVVFIYATAPDLGVARKIARAVVENRAAACVNIIPGVKSVYRWKGRIEEADEIALIVKTTAQTAPKARDLIAANHPYDTPAVAALSVDERLSSNAFCAWIRAASAPAQPETDS
ncbi:MAG: divalent-cation tolerance protein CutA [Parvularculaceae bacterium]|nr:divalent-cation tolerance protein CutA [Parvularculaceae bacterium]